MCLQDQRMYQAGTFERRDISVGTVNPIRLPDLSRALWFRVLANGAVSDIQLNGVGATFAVLPEFSEMTQAGAVGGYRLREHCGSMFNGPLFVGDQLAQVTILEVMWMDGETMLAIQNPRALE